jgi:phosphoglycerate dehydrogenase-like enzyme
VNSSLTYLTTLDWPDRWLAQLAEACPGLSIHRQVVDSADAIPADVWAAADVLHTSAVFPAPGQAPRLRWIQLDTSGAEHVTNQPVWKTNVEITTLGGIAPVPMAEFTTYALLGLAHHQPLIEQVRSAKAWPSPEHRLATMTPLPVDGATATIVGYGRIGREIARLLGTLGMHVIGVSRRGRAGPAEGFFDTGRSRGGDDWVERRSVEEFPDLLGRTDYLIVVVPYTPQTAGMIGKEEIAALKQGACVVNVARGGIVDELALQEALDSGQLTYAALDVFDDEPLPQKSPWWDHPKVLLTPHVAGLAPRYAEQVLELLTTNLSRFRDGLPLLNRVDRAAGY